MRGVPTHFARQWIDSGKWVALTLENPFPDAACCVTWQQNETSPTLAWLLDYLGDSETLNREWLRGQKGSPTVGINADSRRERAVSDRATLNRAWMNFNRLWKALRAY